ncbi:MAG: nuclear transport factor 2 family protein [Verrucomicrobiaceae bacterium]|nr:MAG: nuclear transport factor 2 family protein [Verrucomicrobiaceae bacterium]
MSQQNKDTLEKANAAISAGDHEGFLSHCTEDTKWTFIGDRILKGKEAVRQYMAETYLEPPEFHVDHLIAEGDFVAALGEITLKDKDGNETHSAYCDVWRFRDGKMCELRAFVVGDGGA